VPIVGVAGETLAGLELGQYWISEIVRPLGTVRDPNRPLPRCRISSPIIGPMARATGGPFRLTGPGPAHISGADEPPSRWILYGAATHPDVGSDVAGRVGGVRTLVVMAGVSGSGPTESGTGREAAPARPGRHGGAAGHDIASAEHQLGPTGDLPAVIR
jgi:hypothetical protein